MRHIKKWDLENNFLSRWRDDITTKDNEYLSSKEMMEKVSFRFVGI